MTPIMTEEEQDVADMIRARALEHAEEALSRADAALNAPRPFAGGGDEWEREAREREPDTARPSPPRAAPSPAPAAVVDEGAAPVPMAVLTALLTAVIKEERARSAAAIEELARRVAVLESRLASGENRKGKRK